MDAVAASPRRPLIVPEAYTPLFDPNVYYEHYAFYGGRGGAKSHTIGGALALRGALRTRRIVCGRQFQVSIRESVKELIEQKIHELGLADGYEVQERSMRHRTTGSEFIFIGLDRNPENIKSLEGADDFWNEEAQTTKARSLELVIPTIRKPGSSLIWSWNPRFRTDPVDLLFRGPNPPENSYIRRVSWRDNPWFLRTRMGSERKRYKLAHPKRYLHVWEGDYDENPELAIFQNVQIAPLELDDRDTPLFGMDFGFSRDPNVLLKVYYLPNRFEVPVVYVAEEAYGTKIGNEQLPAFMEKVTEVRRFPIKADSSRPETIDYLNSKGFSVLPTIKGPGSVKNGINWLQGVQIVVHPQCVNFIENVRGYLWKADPEGNALPVPEDEDADGPDALRYAVEDISRHDPGENSGVDWI